MKVRIDIDCTPEEARQFFGLPDVKPLNDAMMAQMREHLQANLTAMDPETLTKAWMTGGMQGWEQLQKMFWSGLGETPEEKK